MTDLVLGAVVYDQKVVSIWDGFLHYFRARELPFDYVLFSSYERQVEAQVRGHIHVAWHSPLAWLQTERIVSRLGRRAEAIAMRDTDRDLCSVILVRSDSRARPGDVPGRSDRTGPTSGRARPEDVPGRSERIGRTSGIEAIADLRGTTVAVGARDSPQATLIPLNHLAREGLMPERDFQVRVFDVLVGKHGDHIGGERDAVRALLHGEADAACILDTNHLAFVREGTLPAAATRILTRTETYDHCNFTVLDRVEPELVARFRELLLAMSYADPEVRPLLDLEGLKAWVPGRVSGYAQLSEAVDRFGTIDTFVRRVEASCR